MTEPFALARKWTRLEYERLVEAEFLGPDERVAPLAAQQAAILIADLLP